MVVVKRALLRACSLSLSVFVVLGIVVGVWCYQCAISEGCDKAYAYSDGWSNDGSYWYYYENGYPASGWTEIYHSGRWDYYYFVDGVMQTGWLDWDGSWFYLADGYGQGIGFYNSDYGVCRMGWQDIYHSYGVWDRYYFRGGGSGRMETGWLDYGGYTYYLSNNASNSNYYSIDYGTALLDMHTIGAYTYSFKNNAYNWTYPMSTYPQYAMFKNLSYVAVLADGVLLGFANIDANGRVSFVQILEEGDSPDSFGESDPDAMGA